MTCFSAGSSEEFRRRFPYAQLDKNGLYFSYAIFFQKKKKKQFSCNYIYHSIKLRLKTGNVGPQV